MSSIAESLWAEFESYWRSILDKLRPALKCMRITAQASRGQVIHFLERAKSRLRVILLTWWYRYRRQGLYILGLAATLTAALLLVKDWSTLDCYLSGAYSDEGDHSFRSDPDQ